MEPLTILAIGASASLVIISVGFLSRLENSNEPLIKNTYVRTTNIYKTPKEEKDK